MADDWMQEAKEIISEMKEGSEKLINFLYALYNRIRESLDERSKGEILPLITRSVTRLKWLHKYCEWLESVFKRGDIQTFVTHLPPLGWLAKIENDIMFLHGIFGSQPSYKQLAVAYLGIDNADSYFRAYIFRNASSLLVELEEAGFKPVERFSEKPPTEFMTEEELKREAEKMKGDELRNLFEQAINVFNAAFGSKRGYERFIEKLKSDFERALETENLLLMREIRETLTSLRNALPDEMRERHETLFEHLFGLLDEAKKRFIKPLFKFKFILSRLFGG